MKWLKFNSKKPEKLCIDKEKKFVGLTPDDIPIKTNLQIYSDIKLMMENNLLC